MIKLAKKEKSLYQFSFQMYVECENKECDVECLMLTNQNVRITYIHKISFLKRENKEITIPLDSIIMSNGIPHIQYEQVNNEIRLIISTCDNLYTIMFYSLKLKSFEKEFNEFMELLKKNIRTEATEKKEP